MSAPTLERGATLMYGKVPSSDDFHWNNTAIIYMLRISMVYLILEMGGFMLKNA